MHFHINIISLKIAYSCIGNDIASLSLQPPTHWNVFILQCSREIPFIVKFSIHHAKLIAAAGSLYPHWKISSAPAFCGENMYARSSMSYHHTDGIKDTSSAINNTAALSHQHPDTSFSVYNIFLRASSSRAVYRIIIL